MVTQTHIHRTKKSSSVSVSGRTADLILEELRMLRNEIGLLLPYEDLEEYEHPERIKRSYERAIKKYPPTSIWK